jgi:hypothetical protein|tara:strand:+ start:509 stop:700 length:192 start_codon:yes stop_codon:yes gene_type:complete
MTIGQKIKKAKKVFAWVMIYAPDDGEYIEVNKSNLREVIQKAHAGLNDDNFKFDEDNQCLYIN